LFVLRFCCLSFVYNNQHPCLPILSLVVRDRTKATVAKVTCMGRVVKSKVDKVIGSKLHSDNVLVTDAWRAYKTYAKEKGLEHYRIKSNDGTHVIKGIYHIQNVNGVHSRLKQWSYHPYNYYWICYSN
jgi:hypothetical protein